MWTIRDEYDIIKTSIIKFDVNICEQMYIVPPLDQLRRTKKILMNVCQLIQSKAIFSKTNFLQEGKQETRQVHYFMPLWFITLMVCFP